MKILLIDDESFILNLLAEVAEMNGHQTVTAGNGADAVKVFRENPDIKTVFCDFTLPDTDGLTVIAQIKAIRPSSTVYLLTGWGVSYFEDKDTSLVAEIITKPFDIQHIITLLSNG